MPDGTAHIVARRDKSAALGEINGCGICSAWSNRISIFRGQEGAGRGRTGVRVKGCPTVGQPFFVSLAGAFGEGYAERFGFLGDEFVLLAQLS
ncbi:hypothetical protein D3C81_1669980 [compost metagenome]